MFEQRKTIFFSSKVMPEPDFQTGFGTLLSTIEYSRNWYVNCIQVRALVSLAACVTLRRAWWPCLMTARAGGSDFALFPIFENLHISVDQVYF